MSWSRWVGCWLASARLLGASCKRGTLRLKALRRGLADRLRLLELEACGAKPRAQSIARRMVPYALGEATKNASWPVNETASEKAHRELLDAIEEDCHAR